MVLNAVCLHRALVLLLIVPLRLMPARGC
ncbi:hypothetical protein E2C01_085085 [Portunus trituberculatus]|uniref:Uncharacterized protein n=1 Tax=Portunus trituberculatus TaxID=210409 RepID=A0A5B7J5R5_PORTR|nr:hypothetical protein [Portunus trituberculatus]